MRGLHDGAGVSTWSKKTGTVLSFLKKPRVLLRGSIAEYALVSIVFFILTLIFTDFVLMSGTHQLFIEGPGDGTAGFLWLESVDKQQGPFFGTTDMVNYPTGEKLTNPTYVTYSVLLIPLWIFSNLFGSVMGLNIVTFLAFFTCALTMYWLMKKLTGNIWVAFFSGVAAAFVPYHVMNSSSHLSYTMSVIFILVLASFIGVWRRPTTFRALLFAAMVALAFYTDGYFILLASVMAACLVLGGFVHDFLVKRVSSTQLIKKLKMLAIVAVSFLVFISPIIYTQFVQSKDISSGLAKARGDIAFDLNNYAARTIDYFIPPVHNIFLINDPAFQQLHAAKNTRSNASESTLYVGYVLIVLCIVGTALAVAFLLKKKSALQRLAKADRGMFILVAVLSLVAIPLLIFWSMPPKFHIFGIGLPSPSGVLLHFGVALWRVMARFFLPLHIMVVVFSGLTLHVLLELFAKTNAQRWARIVIPLLLTIVVGLEFATMTSRPPYEFENIPKAYTWLRDQRNISVVAELPLLDRPLEVNYNYTTAQLIHGKKLINSHLSSNEIGGRNALGDMENQESVDYAIARGAQAIITHDEPCHEVKWGVLVYQQVNDARNKESFYYGSPICIYAVNAGLSPDKMFAKLRKGTFADAPFVGSTAVYNLIYGDKGVIEAVNEKGEHVSGGVQFSVTIGHNPAMDNFVGTWQILQDGKVAASGLAPGVAEAYLDAAKPIEVVVRKLDETQPNMYQVALTNISLTAQYTSRTDQ